MISEKLIQKTMMIGCWIIILFIAGAGIAQAGNGIITGKIVDGKSGDPMIGASVRMFQDGKVVNGASTNISGEFRVKNVVPGLYTLKITYINKEPIEITNFEVKPDEIKTANYTMQEKAVMGQTVKVTSKRISASTAILLKERQRAGSISDAIGAEAISRGGSGTAADAVKHVTGATTVGGKYVYIRGLGDRYSSTQLNGAALPSSDPDKKAVQLDLFPSGMIENIKTVKTATPDRPGDFTGGTVDISTKSFPEKLNVQFSLSTAYNDKTTGASMLTGPVGDLAWLGMNDGTRDLPSEFYDANGDISIPDKTSARSKTKPEAVEAASLLNMQSKAFDPTWAPTSENAPVNQGFSMSVGNQIDVLDRPFGFLANIGYGRKFQAYEKGVSALYQRASGSSNELDPKYLYTENKGIDEVNWGGMVNMAYDLTSNNRFSFNYLYNRSGESMALYQDGFNTYYHIDIESYALQYIERDIQSYQLSGEHNMPSFLGSKLKWQASLGSSLQDEPDLRTFSNDYYYDEETGDKINKIDDNHYDLPTRFFRKLEEDIASAKMDYEIPMTDILGKQSKFKTGLLFNEKQRQFGEQRFVLNQDTENQSFTGDPNDYFAQYTGINEERSQGNFTYFYNYVEDRTSLKGSYDGYQRIFATYGMVDFYVSDLLRFVGGARYETTRITATSKKEGEPTGKISEHDILPSFNLTYHLTDKMNLRAAYSKTLARPSFREIAPYSSYLFKTHETLIGNAELKRSLIDNIDLRWEWFTRPGEILAASAFYKSFKNPIEKAIVNWNNNVMYKNVSNASLFGAEFEFRRNLDFVDFLQDFYFGMNLTLVMAEVDLSEKELMAVRAYDSTASSTRDLQGQSPYVLNLDLAYVDHDNGTEASLHYYIFGERLSGVSFGGSPDVYEKPKPELNLVVSQKLWDNFKIKLSGKNLLNSKNYKAYTYKGKDYVYHEYLIGRTISLSLSYSLD